MLPYDKIMSISLNKARPPQRGDYRDDNAMKSLNLIDVG
jgi:hypothetical protein